MSFLIASDSKTNYKKIRLLKKRYKAIFTPPIGKNQLVKGDCISIG